MRTMRPKTKRDYRRRRHLRIRRKVQGTAERPRMSVFVSDRHMYVQFIDDERGITLAAVSSLSPEFRSRPRPRGFTVELARQLGEMAARTALEKGIRTVVFDRGGFRYGGRVRALAEAARAQGLEF